jgi:hypothetical protein
MGVLMSTIGPRAAMALAGATAVVAGTALLLVESRAPSGRPPDDVGAPVQLDATAA